MFEGEDIAFNGLEVCSYRHLQSMAKNMGLPSNVKKVHLIEMIRAKKYCTETDLKAIVQRVKMERKVNAQAKKKKPKKKTFRLQGTEVSSTSNSHSPPIMHTPKRPSDFVIQYSPDITRTIMKFQPRPNILRTGTSILQPLKRHIESDRVLRSFNSVKRPNYRIMEQNDCVIGVVNAQNSTQEVQQERVHEVRHDSAYQSMNVTVQKHRPIMMLNQDRQLVPMSRSSNISKPVKRQRKLSGIQPLQTLENSHFDCVPTVGFRRPDGCLTKINAIIQRPLSSSLLPRNRALVQKKVARVTVQDVINYKVDNSSNDFGKAVENSRLYEIDYSNENGLYSEYPTDEIAEVNNYEVDSQMFSHETLNTTKTIVLEPSPKNMIQENSRKVYKGCQRVKTNSRNNGWNYSIEYQEHDNPSARKEWNVYDINDQSLDRFDNTDQSKELQRRNDQCYPHNAKEIPISTNYKVKQGRITEPISRDYKVEYQRFNQSITGNVNHAISGTKNQCNQKILDKNINNARSNILNQINQEITVNYGKNQLNQEITGRNLNQARNSTPSQINHEIIVKYASNKNHFNQDTKNDHVRHTEQRFNPDTSDWNVIVKTSSGNQSDKETNRNVNQLKLDTKNQYNKDTDKNTDHRCDLDVSSKYPNMTALSNEFPNEDYTQEIIDRQSSNYSVYYHKKIRAEHVKSQKSFEKLPRINDVFSQFNDVQYKCLMQPLYVQVSEESERVPPLPRVMQTNNTNNTCMLESIYNFKSQFILNPPVLLIATTQTHCTYSTKTVPTAIAQPATADYSNNTNPYERANPYPSTEYTPRLYDYLKPEFMPRYSFGCNEVLSSSTASLDTTNTQELGANVTIPEMVEDALELISQDGDYMERIGMDVRMQCIQCDWAGPKIILEYHIKKDHSHQIQQQDSDEWSCIFTLGDLVSCHTWHSQLVQRGESLLALSAKYTDTDDIQVALSMIPTEPEITKHARITVYNKISGQPYTYEGEIKHLPDSMPYEYGLECLEVDIGKLDLIPNSANLRLVNRELVGSSGRVVVGQPELNRVEISVHVKLLD